MATDSETPIEKARDACDLARLLQQQYSTRDEEIQEQIREQIQTARANLNIAEDELDRVEQLQGGGEDE